MVASYPGLGLVILTDGKTETECATVTVTPGGLAGLLLPGGSVPPLPFTPQMLQQREFDLLQQLFDTTSRAARLPDRAAETDTVQVAKPSTVTVATDNVLPDRPADAGPDAGDAESDSAEEAEWSGRSAPYLRLLGQVDLLHVGDEATMPGRGIELIAYLNLNGAVDGLQLQRSFWPHNGRAENNQRQLVKKVRIALGHHPDGRLLLPENTHHSAMSSTRRSAPIGTISVLG